MALGVDAQRLATPHFDFDNTYRRELGDLGVPWHAAVAPAPQLLVANDELAVELGLDPDAVRSEAGVSVLVGNVEPEGAEPMAMVYAGHQFGGYSPRLGDGRALLLGEVLDREGRRRDLHLKGSGRTPFARGGDGKAVVGPMLREHLFGEAMHALGIPTTRALAVVATGETVYREGAEPGAVLARLAASHLRVGTFEYAARAEDPGLLRRLADYAIARHHPQVADADNPYLAFYDAVVGAQAALVAQWMAVGFIHGVMNTDNTTISGETIDYGPCAFMDRYDPATVFSSIDHGGRYAYGNQPGILQWNLARLGEALLPLIADDVAAAAEAATEVLVAYPERYRAEWSAGMRTKLGLAETEADDDELIEDFLGLLHEGRVDHTSGFRALGAALRGEEQDVQDLFDDQRALEEWLARWRARVTGTGGDALAIADAMDRTNPRFVPRNHLVEEALASATAGDLGPFEALLDAVTHPFDPSPGRDRYAEPAPEAFTQTFQTFCGT